MHKCAVLQMMTYVVDISITMLIATFLEIPRKRFSAHLCSADNKNHLIHTFETLPNFPPESCMEQEENERVQDMAEN